MHQAEDLPRQVRQQVVVETQRAQRVEPVGGDGGTTGMKARDPGGNAGGLRLLPGELRGDALDAVVT